MINRELDPTKPYRYVCYGRMSSDQQNPRSPDQQFQTIADTLARLRYPWAHVKDFRDDAVSGRYERKRLGFRQMLEEIRTGLLQIDLIIVDTLERFGRMDRLPVVRQELLDQHGILILTADTNFADPSSVQGRAYGMIEAYRATEAARIKAHDVLRGKRDAAKQGKWPGGMAPFGFRLKSVLTERHRRQEVDHTELEHDPETAWIIRLLFETAHEKGWGQTRLAKFLSAHPEIPAKFKPFEPPTVGYWLDNPIYYGTLRWSEHSTDIVNDVRVVQRNEEEDILYVPDFCEPIVSKELWESVQAVRQARRERIAQALRAKAKGPSKQIAPLAPGMTLNYLLTGLVRCGHCGRAMDPSSGRAYVTKSGEERTYTAYVCPGYLGGNCENGRRVPEPWLRGVVIAKVRERLLPVPESGDMLSAEWFQQLLEAVRQELQRRSANQTDPRSALASELEPLQAKIQGWMMTLAQADLGAPARRVVGEQLNAALARQEEIEATLAELDSRERHQAELLDPAPIVERLERLDQVLAATNPTMGNLELSLHIDRIDCYSTGRVVLRICRLGSVAGVIDLFHQGHGGQENAEKGKAVQTIKPRRRARLRVDEPIGGPRSLLAAAEVAADPHRFAGLDAQWFWEDIFQIPRRMSWAETHAAEVAKARAEGLTTARLASRFGKSIPTIRQSLRYAALADESVKQLPKKMPRPRWHEDHAAEVAELKAQGMSTMEIARRFGLSDATIRKALDHARHLAQHGNEGGETTDDS